MWLSSRSLFFALSRFWVNLRVFNFASLERENKCCVKMSTLALVYINIFLANPTMTVFITRHQLALFCEKHTKKRHIRTFESFATVGLAALSGSWDRVTPLCQGVLDSYCQYPSLNINMLFILFYLFQIKVMRLYSSMDTSASKGQGSSSYRGLRTRRP